MASYKRLNYSILADPANVVLPKRKCSYMLKLDVAFSIRKNIQDSAIQKSIIKKMFKKNLKRGFPKLFFVKTFSLRLRTVKKKFEPN
jgi:hypothetical protein